ncbi:MAG: TIGR04086 family membrane protein [Candidatus Faecalibacterium intestinavium]|uniref:TIGR04086 family membrane protein n=1 Tax=Candidatus Faecalibacterium intestinavium TaxID=2838580 RepID=A0A9E2NPY1_9FIRM|nr:TIGR04086 family membrane protein [Candidatus Faecalibacterium intestinavium]
MSAKKVGSSALIHFLVSLGAGLTAAGGCTAALAGLMASQGLGHGAIWPFATAAVSVGSFLSGWLMAFLQKARGLFWGAVHGALYSGLIAAQTALSGSIPDSAQLLRLGLVILFGAIGGYLGLLNAGKRRRGF